MSDSAFTRWGEKAYGLADMATKKPVTSETLFQAASISKPVSALAALHLVQEGKLRNCAEIILRWPQRVVPLRLRLVPGQRKVFHFLS